MSRQIASAETYETVHQAFSQINFNAFDYNTIKRSLVDYLKVYYVEDFDDFIESSELIAIIETFAYVGELISYRLDMNAQENFLSTAQRKESILRLAKLISYKPYRNIPHRGLTKITSIKTTEAIRDVDGINLANRRINWNDTNNQKWKDQFLLIMNQVMSQNFGSVGADSRTQVDNVLFELYTFKNASRNQETSVTFPYSVTVSDINFDMELVPVALEEDGPVERRPEVRSNFTFMYASDGLGDASDTTGFLMLTKQGTLQRRQAFFDGITPNQTYTIPVNNINQTDVFVNNVNQDDRSIIINDPFETFFSNTDTRYGEWDIIGDDSIENIAFNTTESRRKVDVETLDNDQIKIIFGDGEFSDIPNGAFDIWFRTSANDTTTIPKSSITDETVSFVYLDANNITQTFTFTFSLVNSLQNSSASETLEHIRSVAPSVYYTQDRMVNARDYNSYMLQDPRIVKLQAINRTFAGDSKYIAWHDPKEYYEDVKLFGDDLAIFRKREAPINGQTEVVNEAITGIELLNNYVQPRLETIDFFLMAASRLEIIEQSNTTYRTLFLETADKPEVTRISEELDRIVNNTNASGTIGSTLNLYYSPSRDLWVFPVDASNTTNPSPNVDDILVFQIIPEFEAGNTHSGWTIYQATDSLIAYSDTTRFWNENGTDAVINMNSLLSENDVITVLSANKNVDGTALLSEDIRYNIVRQESLNDDFDTINSLSILPVDKNNDDIPDNINQAEIFGSFIEYVSEIPTEISPGVARYPDATVLGTNDGQPLTLESSVAYLQGFEDEDVEIYRTRAGVTTRLLFNSGWTTPNLGTPSDASPEVVVRNWIQILASEAQLDDLFRIKVRRYVYLVRETVNDPWTIAEDSDATRLLYFQEQTSAESERRYIRYEGRFPMNFSWFHSTPRLSLIDPAPSNIIDIFVITDGYYRDFNAYINNVITSAPEKPSSYTLSRTFRTLLKSKMISDTVVMHSGSLRVLFGNKAASADRARFKVILSPQNTASENDIKNRIRSVVISFFDSSNWNFGETFYFSELAAAIHAELNANIQTIVLVPEDNNTQFGDLYQIQARDDEIFIPDITSSNIDIVTSLNAETLNQ